MPKNDFELYGTGIKSALEKVENILTGVNVAGFPINELVPFIVGMVIVGLCFYLLWKQVNNKEYLSDEGIGG